MAKNREGAAAPAKKKSKSVLWLQLFSALSALLLGGLLFVNGTYDLVDYEMMTQSLVQSEQVNYFTAAGTYAVWLIVATMIMVGILFLTHIVCGILRKPGIALIAACANLLLILFGMFASTHISGVHPETLFMFRFEGRWVASLLVVFSLIPVVLSAIPAVRAFLAQEKQRKAELELRRQREEELLNATAAEFYDD